jgi:GMP synthase (glutamine-hydrolysing)
MKIALLLLDDYLTDNGEDFADLGKNLLSNIFKDQINNIEFTKFNYVKDNSNLPNLENFQFDVVYLTGSRRDSYLNNEFNNLLINYLKKLYNEIPNIKILGICFGHQIIARSLGLEVSPNPNGWEIGNTIINNDDDDEDNNNNNNIGESFIISEMHRDIVINLTIEQLKNLNEKNIKIFGNSSKCNVQGLKDNKKLLTFQGHPEFNADLTFQMIEDKFKKGLFSQDLYNDAKKRYNELIEDGLNENGNLRLQKIIKEFLIN